MDDQPLSITREADFDIDADHLWHALSDEHELGAWLGDDVAIDVQEGGVGTVVDDGVVRRIRVERVDEGRGLSFTWWEDGHPETASTVSIDIAALPHGRSRLAIVETFDPGPPRLRAQSGAGARDRWGVRVLCLWAWTVAAAALVR